jgi:hypothetical protein
MIGPDQFVNGMWMGTILILLGLAPGLYQAFFKGISRFARLLTLHTALPLPQLRQDEDVAQPRWFAMAGFIVLLLTGVAYLL